MHTIKGQKVSPGIAIGKVMILSAEEVKVREQRVPVKKVEGEMRRFRRALAATEKDIVTLLEEQAGGPVDVRRIISTSLDFLKDDTLVAGIEAAIEKGQFTAPYAVSSTIASLAEQLHKIDNPTFSSKVADLIDIEHRLLNHLLGGKLEKVKELDRQLIVVADDLTPTQAINLDRNKVLAFAIERGSWASHTAILARALGIPAVVGAARVAHLATIGSTVVVDGDEGTVIIDPDAELLREYRQKRRRSRRRTAMDAQQKNLPSVTRDDQEIRLYCNIEVKEDVPRVREYGGRGVGLFRTEFLFLGRSEPLSEDEQYEVYKEALIGMQGNMVTIRSMDVGADKFDRSLGTHREPNPFMGERAIRISFAREEFFRVQLRALLRAGVHGKLRLMFPMIMDLGEFRRAKAILEKAKKELRQRGVSFDEDLKVGSMIELPSAALSIESLADEADFFSIGTNDLTQYTLGVDRLNQRVAHLYAPCHPAILRLLRHIVLVAEKRGKYVSICGEMAGDPAYVPLLIGLGLRNLSMAPPMLPAVKKAVRAADTRACARLADKAMAAADAAEVRRLLKL
ncbi:MAG: phosphoenolpyruvate--protein phosphotransferase [Planctomycetes bacterium]|nr:phosphoenolpyruvate--protein phosphotransferase [Planctomycetota bacterium]